MSTAELTITSLLPLIQTLIIHKSRTHPAYARVQTTPKRRTFALFSLFPYIRSPVGQRFLFCDRRSGENLGSRSADGLETRLSRKPRLVSSHVLRRYEDLLKVRSAHGPSLLFYFAYTLLSSGTCLH